MFRWIIVNSKEGCGKKQSYHVLKYYPCISFDRLRKTTTFVTQFNTAGFEPSNSRTRVGSVADCGSMLGNCGHLARRPLYHSVGKPDGSAFLGYDVSKQPAAVTMRQ